MERFHKKIRYGRRDSEEPQFHSGVSAAGLCCYGITRSAPLDCTLALLWREPCTCFIQQACSGSPSASAGAGWTLVCSPACCGARGSRMQSHVSLLLMDRAALVKCVSLCPAFSRLAPALLSPVKASTLERIFQVFLFFCFFRRVRLQVISDVRFLPFFCFQHDKRTAVWAVNIYMYMNLLLYVRSN